MLVPTPGKVVVVVRRFGENQRIKTDIAGINIKDIKKPKKDWITRTCQYCRVKARSNEKAISPSTPTATSFRGE